MGSPRGYDRAECAYGGNDNSVQGGRGGPGLGEGHELEEAVWGSLSEFLGESGLPAVPRGLGDEEMPHGW